MQSFIKLLKNPLGLTGFLLILFWAIIAILSPVIAPPGPDHVGSPYTITRIGFSSLPKAPSSEAIFGTTGGGYDIFYGLVWGARTAFYVGLGVVGTSAIIGTLIGGIAAFIGGIVDNIVMRITDMFMSFPFMIAVIVITVILGKGLDKVVIALILFGWRIYARVIRSAVLTVKARDYVLAAEGIGASKARVFFWHVMPNSIFPVFVYAALNVGRMVLLAAALSFIGIGAEPGYADWGQMINFARSWLTGRPDSPFYYWYTYTYPSVAIVTFVLGWTLLGDTLRDVLDPKMKRIE